MKLKNLIAGVCALCGFAVSAAELPAGYTQVASVKTDGAQFVNLNYKWQANSSATNEITPSVTVDADTNLSNFLSGVAADVRLLKIFEGGTLVCDFVPGVENTSGDFGLYDRERGMFCPLVRPAEAASVALIDDHETLNGPYVYAGQVLKHNHRYHVTEDTTINAAAMPGVSAVRVPVGAAVVIDIAAGVTLTVIGGPGYGRIPGGAGIEVPRGAKLVVTGDGTLTAIGGAAAAGGTGYGGMGGQFSYIQKTDKMDPTHYPFATEAGDFPDVTNNGVAISEFAENPLYFGRTGEGGNGGDGGGGAGAGIGTKGGTGGLGGGASLGKFVIGGDYYADDKDRYAKFATFFGMDQADWYIYEKGKNVAWDGLNGGNGGNGDSALSCGEIIVASNVVVNAQSGAGGTGGENGPFGSTAQAYDKGDGGGGVAHYDQALNVSATVIGGVGTILGATGNLSGLGTVFGAVGAVLSIASLINDAVNDDVSKMKKQLWLVGGGGGGGGGAGSAGARIGAGGTGGGGGGAGGGGFFEMGVSSVYTMDGGFIGDNIDATVPPLQLSGHGGTGGAGAKDGKSATSLFRGQAEEHRKDQDDDVYNCLQFHGNGGDWRLGASSWQKGAQAFGGLGGAGGLSGEPNTTPFSFLCYDENKVLNHDTIQKPEKLSGSAIAYCVTYHKGYGDDKDSLTGDFICGTLVESAPVIKGPDGKTFDGFYTEMNGKGVQYFDRFRNPSGSPKITSNLHLYANWTDTAAATGFKDVRDGASLTVGAVLQDGTIYRFSKDKEFRSNVGSGLKVAADATAVIYIERNVTVTCKGVDGSGTNPGYPGIEVPMGATLIVTGEGNLVATGGNASAGGKGEDGANGVNDNHVSKAGVGGRGGAGGGGAAAGIGGKGGVGGTGGTGGTPTQDGNDDAYGGNGSSGQRGSDGGACGSVYLLGAVSVTAHGGVASTNGCGGAGGHWAAHDGGSGVAHSWSIGGGGGGGGGGTGLAAGGIGGGAAGGGGGGGGGSGSADMDYGWGDIVNYNWGGYGGAGPDENAKGKTGTSNKNPTDERSVHRPGHGGVFGENGTAGKNGGLYVNEAVKAKEETLSGRYEDIKYAFGHPALERTITFHLDKTETTPEMNVTVAAQIGLPLPVLPDSCVRPAQLRGYVLAGAYEVKNGVSNCWYKAKGEPAKSQYEGLDDVTLDVIYAFDTERLADVPESRSFNYNGSNQVAFVAARNPGCAYLAGATNGTDTGSYEYTVRLNDDYTLWSDFYTNRVRTIPWEITRAPITNEWVNNIITYDWTKSRAENWAAITNDPAKTLGFKLPPDAQVAFELDPNITTDGRQQTVFNVQRLIVRLTGMKNYFDKTYYGTYTCAQPFQLNLRSHYPWAAKLDITCKESSFKIAEAQLAAFMRAYADSPIVAQIRVPDGTGGTKTVTLNAENAYTVWDAHNSGSEGMSVTVDLESVEELAGVRAYSLPVYVSIDGQVFQGGSTTVDTTATGKTEDGETYPLYTVHDVNDIFDIACSVAFVDDEAYRMAGPGVRSLLAIGTWSEPGDRFEPQTAAGKPLTDGFVRWTPTQAKQYRLEHWVANPFAPGGVSGYRRAYFDFRGEQGDEPPNVERDLITRARVTRAATGETIDYTSLAAAVADLRYGDAIAITADVQLENEKIPSGTTVTVERDGVFRRTLEPDLARPYHAADVTVDKGGKVTKAVYHLDEDSVRTTIVGADGLVEDANGRVFTFTIDNVKPDLYYVVRRSDDLQTWTLASKVDAAGATGLMTITIPAEGDVGFYSVSVTDEPPSPFLSEDDGQGGVTLTGITAANEVATDGKLVLPAEIDGKPVTGVAAGAFSARDLTELVVPAGIKTVGALDLRGLKILRFLGKPDSIGDLLLSPGCIAYVPQDAGWTGVPSAEDENWHGGKLEYWVDFDCIVMRTDRGYEASITGCGQIPLDGRLRIPQTIGGVPVTSIAAEAFRDLPALELEELVIPEGVEEIDGGAFCGCDGLKSLELPASLVRLGRCVFGEAGNLSNLESLTFNGDAPDYGGDVGLDPAKCTIYAYAGLGWGETWQGCPVLLYYCYWDPVSKSIGRVAKCTKVTSETKTLENGRWYVVEGSVETTDLRVSGTANLILCDGATLTANGTRYHAGLEVDQGTALVIYGQAAGTGRLVATGGESSAGIGGSRADYGYGKNENHVSGTVTINGGFVTATGRGGNSPAAGIGGGGFNNITMGGDQSADGYAGGDVTVNGGTVRASGGIPGGDDIGGSHGKNGSSLTINGGSVVAVHDTTTEGNPDWGPYGSTPKTSDGTPVYRVTVNLDRNDGPVEVGGLEDLGYGTVGLHPVDWRLCLWLPNGIYDFTVDGKPYSATVANGPTTAYIEFYTYEDRGDGTVRITGLSQAGQEAISGSSSDAPLEALRIPSARGGLPVVEIGCSAFANCSFAGELEIPATVTLIGAQAFESSPLTALYFTGNCPETSGEVGLNPAKCTIYVIEGSTGWGETWQGCKVCPFDGYRIVDYIESTGREYIDTLVKASSTLAATMDYTALEHTGDVNLGTCVDDSADWRYFDYSGGPIFDCGSARTGKTSGNTLDLSVRYVVNVGKKGSNNYLTVTNAETKAEVKSFTTACSWTPRADNVGVFGGWSSSSLHCTKMRLYSLQLKQDGVPLRDFVPCKSYFDGAYGLYDRVEGKFYGNESGYGAFVGPATAVVAQ